MFQKIIKYILKLFYFPEIKLKQLKELVKLNKQKRAGIRVMDVKYGVRRSLNALTKFILWGRK